jgi:hypothetical protein
MELLLIGYKNGRLILGTSIFPTKMMNQELLGHYDTITPILWAQNQATEKNPGRRFHDCFGLSTCQVGEFLSKEV